MNKPNNRAVKAIIYKEDGSLLLQQRDNSPGLPFPEHWNFFGGMVEQKETLVAALQRELTEEIGSVPGVIGNELFRWQSSSEGGITDNHFFTIRFETVTESLQLQEGKSMQWFLIGDVVKLSLTPSVYENLDRITEWINRTCRR